MCVNSTDMIGEIATIIANGLTIEDLVRAMHAHSILVEIVDKDALSMIL